MTMSFILQKVSLEAQKAVAPDKGAAAFSHSTAIKGLSHTPCFPVISQHVQLSVKDRREHNFLPKNHYFRPGLADATLPLVVRIEGQAKALQIREVA